MLPSGNTCKDCWAPFRAYHADTPQDGAALNLEIQIMSTPSSENSKAIENAADVASTATSKVAGRISSKLDEAARTASRFSDKLRDNGAALQEELSAAGERFGDGAKRLSAVTSEQIRAHPLAAIGIAVAAGYVVARLLRRL